MPLYLSTFGTISTWHNIYNVKFHHLELREMVEKFFSPSNYFLQGKLGTIK